MYTTQYPNGKQLTPLDQLIGGSPVRVGNETGYVMRSETLPAHPSGYIVVHDIVLTKTIKRVSPGRYKVTSHDNKPIRPNYSHVYAL